MRMQHTIMSNNYYVYYFLPILACAYLTLFQYSFFDFNLGTFLTTSTSTATSSSSSHDHHYFINEQEEQKKENQQDAGSTATHHPIYYVTGSFANCTGTGTVSSSSDSRSQQHPQEEKEEDSQVSTSTPYYTITISNTSTAIRGSGDNNSDCKTPLFQDFIGSVLVSCQTISFRAPASSFLSSSGEIHSQIITGVLSSAIGNSSKQRRQSIRKTWAHRSNLTTTTTTTTSTTTTRTGTSASVYFLLAGPWENIQEEYYTYQDIIWIDQEEVYNGEKSVLTLKTYSFFQIVYAILQEYHVHDVTHLFKTDDDSYVNLHALHQELQQSGNSSLRHDYFGQCQFKYPQVHRESEYKWPIRNETYPEPWFPRYCQGAGFGISLDFLTCAAGKGHVSNIRFMPFEDVAVGMLAERCGVDPERPVTARVKVFRYQSDEVKKRTRLGDPRTDDLVPPAACMMHKIVQHRIIDEYDMEEHHKSVLDPSYCNVTKVKRDELIQRMKDQGIEWFG